MVLSSNENNFTLEYASLNQILISSFDDLVMDYSDEQNFSNNKLNFEVFDDFNKSLKGSSKHRSKITTKLNNLVRLPLLILLQAYHY